MQISDLARNTGTSARSLRHYESAGLLPSTRRSNGYRDYSDEASARVMQIRALLTAGLNLAEIRQLLSCVIDDRPKLRRCNTIRAIVEHRLTDLDRRIAQLTTARTLLADSLNT